MIKMLVFMFFGFLFCTLGLSLAEENQREKFIYTNDKIEFTVEYHNYKNKTKYKKTIGNDIFTVILHDDYNHIHKSDGDYFNVDVNYNGVSKSYKYPFYKEIQLISIVNAQATDLFCNKKYIVLTMSEYTDSFIGSDYNSYIDIYFDIDSKTDNSSVFYYDEYNDNPKYETQGPIELNTVKRTTKQICHKDGIEFIYDNVD